MRRAIIRSDDGLLERDQRKRAGLREAIRAALVGRGVAEGEAVLFAEVTVTVLNVALEEWLDQEGDRPLFGIVLDSFGSLKSVVSTFPAAGVEN